MAMSVPVRVPIDCPSCAGALTAVLGPPDSTQKSDPWQCPYCFKLQLMKMPGPILYVSKRPDRESQSHRERFGLIRPLRGAGLWGPDNER
jgi:hypothetical protein